MAEIIKSVFARQGELSKKPHPATKTSNSLIRQRELSKSLIRQRELSGSSSGNENFQKSLSGNENFQKSSSGNENSQKKHHPATNFSKRIIEQRELFRNHRSEKKKLTKYRKGETTPPNLPSPFPPLDLKKQRNIHPQPARLPYSSAKIPEKTAERNIQAKPQTLTPPLPSRSTHQLSRAQIPSFHSKDQNNRQ